MTGENNFSVKVTADLNDAKSKIDSLNESIQDTADITERSNTKSAQSWKSLYESQTEAMDRGQRYIIEKLKQEKAEEQAEENAAKAAAEHKKHIEKLRSELDSLLGSIDPAVKALGKLDEQERKLRQSNKAGLINQDELDGYLNKIDEQRNALSNVDDMTQSTGKLSLNTRTARRDIASMIRQLASGNFASAGNSLFNIGNTTGRLPPLFSAATLSVGVFIGAMYGIGKVISGILAEQEKFNKSLVSTGNYAGTTASGLESMSKRIGSIGHNYSETRESIAGLAQEGQLSAELIENIGTAAAYMSALTGQSNKDAVASFDKIKDSVTAWALESNKQYHWMDLATYQRIAALEAQGDTEQAIAIATGKYADVLKERAEEMKNQLNWLESAWQRFKNGVSDLGDSLKTELKLSLGLSDLDEEIQKLEQAKKQGIYTFIGGSMEWDDSFEKELQEKYDEREKLQKQAQSKRDQSVVNEKAIAAQKELDELHKQNASDIEKQALAVDNVRKKYEALWKTVDGRKSLQEKGVMSEDGKTFAGGQYDTDVKEITDKGIKQYNTGLEKTLNLTTELSKVMYEINEGQYKNATQAEKDKGIALAKQLDAKNEAKKNSSSGKQALSNDKTNLGLQQQLNQLLYGTKNNDDTVDQWYNNLLTQFKKAGNKQGIDLIDQLLPLKKAEANLTEITTKIQQAKANQTTKEQSLQAQVTSGLITQVEAQSQLVTLHQKTAAELSSYLPMLEQMASMPGQVGEQGQKALAQLQLEVAELQKTTDSLTNAFKSGLQNGIQSSLDSLAKGTFELGDALTNLAQSILTSMAQIATQGLSEMAMNGLTQLGGSLFGGGAVDAASDVAASAEMSTAISAAAAVGATEMGTAITGATTAGSTVLTTSLNAAFSTGASILSAAIASATAGNGAVSGLSAAASVAAATGGYIRGPGTATSDSIPARLSNGEYVIKEAAVRHYGVDYFDSLNQRKVRPFASGGLASNVSVPSAPKLNEPNIGSNVTTQASPVIQQTLVLDSGEVIESGLGSVTGQRAFMTVIRANAQTIKQVLG